MAVLAATVAGQAEIQGVGPYNWRTATEAQFREVLSAMLAQTNEAACSAVGVASLTNSSWGIILCRRDLDGLRAESDAALAAKGFAAWWSCPHAWPRISAAHRARFGIDAMLPTCLALAERYGCDINSYVFMRNGATVGELAACLGEVTSVAVTQSIVNIPYLDAFKQQIQRSAQKGIKRALRKQGKSFVTKDGINPCEAYMTRLTAALNAPKLAGLNEWLADLGFAERVDLSRLPSEADVVRLKEDVLNGDADMTVKNKATLYICLGVDGYNQLVREYNGD